MVVSYREAFTDGDRLWLVYETETSNHRGKPVGHGSRTAVLALDDLDPARGYPLDALPLERTHEVASSSSEPRRVNVQSAEAALSPSSGGPLLLVEEAGGRATGFSLVAFEGLPPDARFYSGSLLERKTAPWVYPLLPLTLACDAISASTTAVFAIPFFVIGD